MRQISRGRGKWLTALLSITLVAAVAVGCGNKDKAVVATYKNGQVTQADLTKFTNVSSFFNPYISGAGDDPQLKDLMLKQLIAVNVLSARASDASKKGADSKVKEQMQQFDDYYKQNQADMDKQMKELKINRKDIETYMRQSFTVMNDLDSKVTDQQIKDAYDNKLKTDPHFYDVATVRHILVTLQDPATGKDVRNDADALKRAQEAKSKLDAGGSFDQLAKEYSDDPGSKDNGGKYENTPTAQWDPDFGNAVKTLPLNKISDPVKSAYGYHIIKVESRSVQPMDQVKEELKSEASQTLMNDFIEKELPALDFKSKLPAPSASPSAPAASAAPSASPSASPAK